MTNCEERGDRDFNIGRRCERIDKRKVCRMSLQGAEFRVVAEPCKIEPAKRICALERSRGSVEIEEASLGCGKAEP